MTKHIKGIHFCYIFDLCHYFLVLSKDFHHSAYIAYIFFILSTLPIRAISILITVALNFWFGNSKIHVMLVLMLALYLQIVFSLFFFFFGMPYNFVLIAGILSKNNCYKKRCWGRGSILQNHD